MPEVSEEKLDERNRQLKMLLELDKARDSLQENAEPEAMFHALTRLLKNQFRADACAIMLTEENHQSVELVVSQGMAEEQAGDDADDEDDITLEEVVNRKGSKILYTYDFGDDWWHKITFQKPTKKDLELFTGAPVCVEAYGACPPEDSGGPWGYANFLDIIYNKKHPEYRETREWIGLSSRDKYDTEYVDVDFVNEQLSDFYRSKEWNIKADLY